MWSCSSRWVLTGYSITIVLGYSNIQYCLCMWYFTKARCFREKYQRYNLMSLFAISKIRFIRQYIIWSCLNSCIVLSHSSSRFIYVCIQFILIQWRTYCKWVIAQIQSIHHVIYFFIRTKRKFITWMENIITFRVSLSLTPVKLIKMEKVVRYLNYRNLAHNWSKNPHFSIVSVNSSVELKLYPHRVLKTRRFIIFQLFSMSLFDPFNRLFSCPKKSG